MVNCRLDLVDNGGNTIYYGSCIQCTAQCVVHWTSSHDAWVRLPAEVVSFSSLDGRGECVCEVRGGCCYSARFHWRILVCGWNPHHIGDPPPPPPLSLPISPYTGLLNRPHNADKLPQIRQVYRLRNKWFTQDTYVCRLPKPQHVKTDLKTAPLLAQYWTSTPCYCYTCHYSTFVYWSCWYIFGHLQYHNPHYYTRHGWSWERDVHYGM